MSFCTNKYLFRKYSYNIINVDKLSYGSNIENLNDIRNNYLFVQKDISEDLSDIVDKVDYIVNFAAESHVDRSIAEPGNFARDNINGVINLLENIRKSKNNPKIIQIVYYINITIFCLLLISTIAYANIITIYEYYIPFFLNLLILDP